MVLQKEMVLENQENVSKSEGGGSDQSIRLTCGSLVSSLDWSQEINQSKSAGRNSEPKYIFTGRQASVENPPLKL